MTWLLTFHAGIMSSKPSDYNLELKSKFLKHKSMDISLKKYHSEGKFAFLFVSELRNYFENIFPTSSSFNMTFHASLASAQKYSLVTPRYSSALPLIQWKQESLSLFSYIYLAKAFLAIARFL